MIITYSIFQASLIKGVNLKASKVSEITDTIKELNSLGDKLNFEAFISKIEA
jgi:hypothetical protein